MKRVLLLVLALLLLCGAAQAEVKFVNDAYMGFQGEEIKVRIYSDGKDGGKTVSIVDDNGNVLSDYTLRNGKGNWTITFTAPVGSAGANMSLLLEGETVDTALLAAETRPGYSVTRVDRDDKKIALTFDAANAASKTMEILDVLESYGAKGTFFVIGRYVINNPEETRAIEARGHELGGHSWDHDDVTKLTNDQILKDFAMISEAFINVLGHDVNLYRPPSGYSSQRDRAIGRALGQEVIKWTVDSKDGFKDTTLNTVIKRVQNNVGSGDIVLMHVYGKHTINALNVLLPYYIEQGYEFVTVSDLLLDGNTAIDTDGVQHLVQE